MRQHLKSASLKAAATLLLLPASAAIAAPIVYTFETEDDLTTPLLHGQIIDQAFDAPGFSEFGNVFNVSSTQDGTDGHLGVTVFDSDLSGTADPDLEVGTGNILILQNDDDSARTGDFYDTPNDERDRADRGSIVFDFTETVAPLSINIVDANGGFGALVTMTDTVGRTRVYTIPEMWSNEVTSAPNGFDTLLLTDLAPQDGEGAGGDATATEDLGFNEVAVVQLSVSFVGAAGVGGSGNALSGGIDDLVLDGVDGQNIPEPGAAVLLLGSILGLASRRRR
ncbi:MAG: hypothetical protein AAGA92_00670 [Planctomycetota bacterium]